MATLFYMMKCGERRGQKGRKNDQETTQKVKSKTQSKGKNQNKKWKDTGRRKGKWFKNQ